MLLNISNGEALDRLSILEIKKTYIKDDKQLTEINKELQQYNEIYEIKYKYILYYKLLYYVNKQIWDRTNEIKERHIYDEQYAKWSYEIFEWNQQRFRMKDIINRLENSVFKEQKSYFRKNIVYLHNMNTTFDELFNILLYLLLTYDNVKLINSEYLIQYQERIKTLLPSLELINYDSNNTDILHTKDVHIPDMIKQDLITMIIK